MPVPAVRLAALLLLLLLPYLSGCTSRTPGGPWPDRAGAAPPSPAPTVPTFTLVSTPAPSFTPTATATLAPTFTPIPTPVPLSTPSLTRSGIYDNLAMHTDGRYELQLTGTRVAATFSTSHSPVEHWARAVLLPLFTVPDPFRPPYPILRTVEGRPVHADGAPDPARLAPHRFLLRVDPDGGVHYVDDARVEGAGHLAYALHTAWDTSPAAATIPSGIGKPTPSLMHSGDYDNPAEHADGRYELQLSGTRVAAIFFTSRSPVQYWAREVAPPLFTVPEPFRPPYSILRTAEGIPVRADGSPDPDHPEPRRFLLRVDPEGTVHYVDDARVEGVGYLAYALDTVWGTVPAANDRAVLEILDRHWFGKTLLSAEPPPMQFEAPAFGIIKIGTIPTAMVGSFVTFDADGRVTALGAPSDAVRVLGGAPIYTFNGPLLPELGQLHHLEHLDLGYRTYFQTDAKRIAVGGGVERRKEVLTDTIPLQLWRLPRLRHLDLRGHRLAWTLPSDIGRPVSLEYLDLSNNRLTDLPPALGHLASLKHLDLGDNDFTDLPPALGQLASLQRLDLYNNQLSSGSLPSEIGDLASLSYLDLSGNRLTDLPSALGRLASLQRLDLNNNQLSSGSLPPELGRLAFLEYLDLSYNRLTALPSALGRLINLEQLNLRGNRLTAPPSVLGQLANLQWLDLGYNGLTVLSPEWGQLANLQWLDLGYNQLTGALPPEWGQLSSLKYLDLHSNQLTGPLPAAWGQLASLEDLSLGDNQLTGALPAAWGRLASLRGLGLSGNQLTGSLPPEWGQLASLEDLSLSDNQLTGALPPEWGQLTNLQYLILSSNQLTGSLPPEWSQLAAHLHVLDLRDNQLTGCFLMGTSEDNYIVHDLPSCPPIRAPG